MKRKALMNTKKARDHTHPEGTAYLIGSAMEDWAQRQAEPEATKKPTLNPDCAFSNKAA